MKEMIYRDDAIRIAEQGQVQGYEWQFKKLCSLPSANPEVIYCEHCKNSYLFKLWDSPESRFCRKFRKSLTSDYDISVEDDDYCSFAERK